MNTGWKGGVRANAEERSGGGRRIQGEDERGSDEEEHEEDEAEDEETPQAS